MPGRQRLDLGFFTPGSVEFRAILRSRRRIAPRFKRSWGGEFPAPYPRATPYPIAKSLDLELWLTKEVVLEV